MAHPQSLLTPAQCEGPNIPQKDLNRQVNTVGGEMHWGFILLHPVDFCMHWVGACTLKFVHTQFTHSRPYWQLLQSLKGREWEYPNASSSAKKAESQAGQPPWFGIIFLVKRSCVPHGQVAAVPIALFFPVPVMTNSWPCRGQDPGEPQQRHQKLFMAPAKSLHLRHPNYFKFKTQLWKASLSCNILPIAPVCTGLAFQTTALLRS